MRIDFGFWLAVSTGIAAAVVLASMADAAPGQTAAVADHHREVTSCVDVSADSPRTPYGCFNVARVTGLAFETPSVVWYLYRFDSRTAADAARSEHGMVVNEAGAFWLSELAPEGTAPARHAGATLAAQVGPLVLSKAVQHTATLAYAIMKPGQRSRIHTHPGPEAFYVISGSQCVETPAGVQRANAGGSFSEPADVPMELMATGTEVRQGFALVLHDSAQRQAAPVEWHPSNLCGS